MARLLQVGLPRARVVRRRAVPREVGAPPGGPSEVKRFIPVVFFTANGIPGEVDQHMDSPEGTLAASMRAHGLSAGAPLPPPRPSSSPRPLCWRPSRLPSGGSQLESVHDGLDARLVQPLKPARLRCAMRMSPFASCCSSRHGALSNVWPPCCPD